MPATTSSGNSSRKPRRFFYHFYKAKGAMSIHFNKTCHVVKDVKCEVPCETKWRPRQPRLIMQGFARNVRIENGVGYIS